MNTRTKLMGASLALALTGCAGTQQADKSSTVSAHCAGLTDVEQEVSGLYTPDQLAEVSRLYSDERLTQAPHTRAGERAGTRSLAGAELYVRAQRGVSSAYLERVLSCHAAGHAGMDDHPNDPLRVDGIRSVDVSEAGSHFRVAIRGTNPEAADAIWERAQALGTGSSTGVQVQQVSATSTEGEAL